MIFSALNEKGTPMWELVLSGQKTVTRRRRPRRVGSIVSIQKARATKGVARARIVSCQEDEAWQMWVDLPAECELEAAREGFGSWEALWNEIQRIYPKGIPTLYRIEFQLIHGD